MRNFVQVGVTVDATFPYAVAAGGAALIGPGLFGVAPNDTANGATAPLTTAGLYDLPKKPGEAIAAGAKLYWDNTNKYLTATASGNTYVASAPIAADASASTVRARLNGVAI